jgi:acyl-CoA synthetase (AMP-forming)/AMP-acid ligase II
MSEALTILDLIHRWGQARPERLAFRFLRGDEPAGHELSFAGLQRNTAAAAHALRARAPSGSRAVLLFDTEPGFIASFFGCLAAGLVAVPVDPPHGRRAWSGIERVVADCEPALVLTTRVIESRWHEELARLADSRHLQVLVIDDVLAAVDTTVADGGFDGGPGTIAFLQYTSGSTAQPKGVMVTHANVMANLRMLEEAFALTGDEQIVGWLPLFHDMGLVGFVLVPVYLGCTSTILSPAAFLEKPVRWLRAITRFRGTISSSPNFGYDLCCAQVRDEDRRDLDLSSWRAALNGSEPVSARTMRRFEDAFGPRGFGRGVFRPCYGMAESTLLISATTANAPVRVLDATRAAGGPADAAFRIEATDVVGCGRPSRGGTIAVVDPSTGRECAAGQIGEVWFSGDNVAAGYWRNPAATAETFAAHLDGGGTTYLRTGDLGCVDDGELFLVGRLKELIIVRGRNVAPQDVEAAASIAHEALRGGHVAAVTVAQDGEPQLGIVAEIAREHWRTFDAGAVVDAVLQAVHHELALAPAVVILLRPGGIPKTTSGKLKRVECRRRIEGVETGGGEWSVLHEWRMRASDNTVSSAVLTPAIAGLDRADATDTILEWLRARLAQVLDCSPDLIGDEDPFARWGLDSAVAVTLTGELAAWLQVELDATVFWEHAHPLALAEHLAGLAADRASAADPVEQA